LLEIMGATNLTATFEVQEKLTFELVPTGIDDLRRQALENRPDLAAARYGVERSARRLDLEHANAVPNMTATFGYKRDFGVNTPVAAVSMPLPLFNRNKAGVTRATAEVEQQKQEVSRVSLAVSREVQEAYQALNAQAEKVKALQEDYVASANRSRDIAQQSYKLGSLDLIGLLDSERSYRETLRTYNQALYDYKAAIFELEAAVGKEF
jgi:outer membrane protein, heavy metal efflux system